MHPFSNWLSRVLTHGESVQEAPPELVRAERPQAIELLREAFADHALDVARPPVAFDPQAALGAVLVLSRACWRLVADGEDDPARLAVGCEPATPSAHLSADVCLRLLPAVYRRARLRSPTDGLTAELDRLLREWPLSGVLADLDGEPTTPPEFGEHAGLQLLYAERLATTGRAGWVPQAGSARAWVERVYDERGKPAPVPPPKEEARA